MSQWKVYSFEKFNMLKMFQQCVDQSNHHIILCIEHTFIIISLLESTVKYAQIEDFKTWTIYIYSTDLRFMLIKYFKSKKSLSTHLSIFIYLADNHVF